MDRRYQLACPRCGKAREVGYSFLRHVGRGGSALCYACSHPRLPARTTVWCLDCGQPREIDTYEARKGKVQRCGSCSAKRNRAARRPKVLRREMDWRMTCPDCGHKRAVAYRYWLKHQGVHRCCYCSRTGVDPHRAKHPIHVPRRLSFDLSAAVAEFLSRGGAVSKCPDADLREPEPRRAPLPAGYAFEGGALVPICEAE